MWSSNVLSSIITNQIQFSILAKYFNQCNNILMVHFLNETKLKLKLKWNEWLKIRKRKKERKNIRFKDKKARKWEEEKEKKKKNLQNLHLTESSSILWFRSFEFFDCDDETGRFMTTFCNNSIRSAKKKKNWKIFRGLQWNV